MNNEVSVRFANGSVHGGFSTLEEACSDAAWWHPKVCNDETHEFVYDELLRTNYGKNNITVYWNQK